MMTRRSSRVRLSVSTVATVLLPVVGCSEPRSEAVAAPEVFELSGSRVFARDELRGFAPISFAEHGLYVLVADLGADSSLAIFDTTGSYLGRSGPEGDGPHDIGTPSRVWADDEGFLLWDQPQARLSRINAAPPWRPEPLFTVPGGAEFMDATLVGDEVVLSGLWRRRALFSRWTPGAVSPTDFGELPPVASEHWKPVSGPSPSLAAVHPDGSKIAVVFSYSGELVIARISDGETLSVSRRGDWDVVIEEVVPRPGVTDTRLRSPIAYMYVCATESAIYALWVGEPMGEGGLGIDPREIHVYNWDGVLTAIWRTDAPVLQPVVVGDRLYTMWPEPIPEVRVWDIGHLVR